ncbi:MAG: GNAT family N-acetyltransferase [Oscillospiraceae bacterium]|nr:GNAT family N-acetyltransferase [Oscillospiraceae bacterium]
MIVLRHGNPGDLEAVSALEALCFPPAEAADRATLAGRLAVYPEHFLLLWEEGKLLAFLDGFCTPEPDLRDEMYADPSLHREDGAWQMIFGVDTHPDHRRRGYATRLLERLIREAREAGRLGLVLTCKEALLPFYARLGFRDEGVTEKSVHGGTRWHQMRLRFREGAGERQ